MVRYKCFSVVHVLNIQEFKQWSNFGFGFSNSNFFLEGLSFYLM